jgi:hypothetical protein
LIARDIERARDDGIGTYNQVRQAYGLKPVTSFAQITSDVTVQRELQKAYGTVDKIDPFEGGMAEDHVAGSDLGPLFTRIIADQFNRLRAGDRFFYQNETWNADELKIMGQGNTLAKVIAADTGITNLQADVFTFTASISGGVFSQRSARGQHAKLDPGLAGITVQLSDSNGDVVATTITDRAGDYTFNQQNGLSGTGIYTVSLIERGAGGQAPNVHSMISISRGGLSVNNVDFVISRA